MIKAGIIGATGYAGQELVRLLLQHPQAEIVWYGSRSYIDQNYYDVYKNMFRLVDAKCMDDNMEELAEQADVIFTATPQGLCASLVNEEILKMLKFMRSGTESSTGVPSISGRRCTVCVRLTERGSEAPDWWRIRAVIPPALSSLCIRW